MASWLRFDRIRRVLGARLWLRPAISGLFAVGMAVAALYAGRIYDGTVPIAIDESSLVTLFGIFASSMLSVATFTVSAIVSAASSASSTATPRAARLVLSDNTAQIVLSAFIAAFIYSVVGIIALKAFVYGPAGRLVLFAGLIVIIGFVLISFINWIDHAMKLGRQSTVIDKLADAARDSLTPDTVGTFGARVWHGDIPAEARAVHAREVGFVVSVDTGALERLCKKLGAELTLVIRPGDLVSPHEPIGYLVPASAGGRDLDRKVSQTLELDQVRHHDCDVRFNLLNLAETADRALSPAVNDPGTAINILAILLDVLSTWADVRLATETSKVRYGRIAMPPLTAREIVSDAFTAIARDGAGMVEVGVRLQKVLATLARIKDPEFREELCMMSDQALELADQALPVLAHRELVEDAAALVQENAAAQVQAPDPQPSLPLSA